MGKKVAILQSNYIPWKGYFDIINLADLFVFYDDVQFTVRDWRNRNKIKTSNGTIWLTIPCGSNRNRLISEVKINDINWQKEHWKKIYFNYNKAHYFKDYKEFFENLFLSKKWTYLSEFNQYVIKKISYDILNIETEFIDSKDFKCSNNKMYRILEIIDKISNVSEYLSGPSAKNYLVEDEFKKRNIKLNYMDYTYYPEYNQLYPPFIHEVSIIDLIFNEGPNSKKFMKSFK